MKKIVRQPLRLSKKSAVLLGLAAFALSASSAFAQAQCTVTTTWTGGASSWFTAANWNNGVPTSTLAAVINNGGTAQISSSLRQANACSLLLGNDISNSGTVSLTSNATLGVTDSVVVANKGRGALSIVGMSAVTSGSSSIAVQAGQLWASNGTVTVDTGSSWTINGTLTVGAGNATMAFGVIPTSPGNYVTVSGTASLRGTLSVTMTGNFQVGQQFTLLTATGGRSGTFSPVSITYPTNQGWCPQITYDATHVKLVLVTCSGGS
jgi:fibronectin-binding autotransporter adhesin